MKISILQFEPIMGGETTLCKNLQKILQMMGHDVCIYHPCETRGEKLHFPFSWVQLGEKISWKDMKEVCENSEVSIFLNSVHVSPRFLDIAEELFLAFQSIKECNIALYEHGLHTWELCNYENVLAALSVHNKVSFLVNTEEAMKAYEKIGLTSFLCRQPFFPELFPPVKKSASGPIELCFNSRFSPQKGLHKAVHYFEEFLNDESLQFSFNFRESGNYPQLKSRIQSTLHGKVLPACKEPWEMYDSQDYCVYFGYDDPKERGKIEYSLLEAFYYEIPVLAHPSWCRELKAEYMASALPVISMSPHELKKILQENLRISPPSESKKVLEKFLPSSISQNLEMFLREIRRQNYHRL